MPIQFTTGTETLAVGASKNENLTFWHLGHEQREYFLWRVN